MVWKYEKFKGDMAIYAFCPKCEFYHCPSKWNTQTRETELLYQYNYCPICGEYLNDKNFENGVSVIWNERDIVELYE